MQHAQRGFGEPATGADLAAARRAHGAIRIHCVLLGAAGNIFAYRHGEIDHETRAFRSHACRRARHRRRRRTRSPSASAAGPASRRSRSPKEAGIFKKNGLDVTIKKIPQKDRHLAIASGDIQCAATTVETWIVWNANGVATKQIFQMDKSYGADGMAVRNDVAKIADLKGKTIAARRRRAPRRTSRWRGS